MGIEGYRTLERLLTLKRLSKPDRHAEQTRYTKDKHSRLQAG